MNRFTIQLAEQLIDISSFSEEVREYCIDYIVNKEQLESTPSGKRQTICIRISQADIEYEREMSRKTDIKERKNVGFYSDGYLETLAVYRKIADALLSQDIILFHGSVISKDGEGYLFTAKSGTGKSTHTKLWREYFGEHVIMVNDDKPLLKITDCGVLAYGTPWDGKHRLSNNISAPLKGICILGRAEENQILKLQSKEEIRSAYPTIVQQTYRSKNSLNLLKTMRLVDRLIEKVPLYRLNCNMKPEAARVAYEGMKE